MAEDVIIKYGHFEVHPERMKKLKLTQRLSEFELDMIVKLRHDYLDWVHYNFAKKVLKPPHE